MKVVVIGVTGRIGKRVAKELLSLGHEVLGVNRRPERVPVILKDIAVPTVKADAGDYEGTLRHIQSADAVLLATAPTREHPEQYGKDCETVLRACKEAKCRLVAVSSFKALKMPDGRPVLEAEPSHPYFVMVELVHSLVAEAYHRETEADWLLVAPPAELVPYGEVTGQYRVGQDVLLINEAAGTSLVETSRISMEDFAHFLCQEIVTPRYHRVMITLAY